MSTMRVRTIGTISTRDTHTQVVESLQWDLRPENMTIRHVIGASRDPSLTVENRSVRTLRPPPGGGGEESGRTDPSDHSQLLLRRVLSFLTASTRIRDRGDVLRRRVFSWKGVQGVLDCDEQVLTICGISTNKL
ncbi:1,4-alpha-glucan-branching protein [Anopheles sinensis]|uniref:1,4-alpha-glucan-branching protein n=1 Tax=Anopheles sinensis TaxID=74873 RepID=A0A084VG27_ANOSI|nr:1,4-alpha-glucan-branching protein [Anopheles sinensis]